MVAFGELHPRVDRPTAARSALARFTEEILPAIAARASDLVLETWLFDVRCGAAAREATAEVEAAVQRPEATTSELASLVERARAAGIQPHAMRLSCDDWARIARPGAEPDLEAMLGVVTRELGRVTVEAARHRAARPLVVVYGGALHNDLHPIDGLAEWSFAAQVDAATAGGYLEVDLYVPEYAAADPLSQAEPWFPLVAHARPDRVVVYARSRRSYVLILPAAAR